MLGQILTEKEDFCNDHCNDMAVSKNDILHFKFETTKQTMFEDNMNDALSFSTLVDVGTQLHLTSPFTQLRLCVPPYTEGIRLTTYSGTIKREYVLRDNITWNMSETYRIIFEDQYQVIYYVRYDVVNATVIQNFINAINETQDTSTAGSLISEIGGNTYTDASGYGIQNHTKKFWFSVDATTLANGVTPTPQSPPNIFGYNHMYNEVDNNALAFNNPKIDDVCSSGGSSGWNVGDSNYIRNFINLQGQQCKDCTVSFVIENLTDIELKYRWRVKNGFAFFTPIVDIILAPNTRYEYSYQFQVPNVTINFQDVQFVAESLRPNPDSNDLKNYNYWYSFDSLKFETEDRPNSIQITDCNGTSTQSYEGVNEIDLSDYEGFVDIILNFNCNRKSIVYERLRLLEDVDCSNYLKVQYKDNCSDVINTFYIYGTITKGQAEVVNNESYVDTNGRKLSVYKHTIAQYELRIHPYTSNIQENLEVILNTNDIWINDKHYYAGDNVYQVDEIEDFIYSGRIDLYKSGTETIKKLCC